MKGRKIRIRQGIKGWLLALAMVLSLCSGWKQDVCAQQSQSSSSNLMQDVDTDKKGSIEILFDTMRDEPVANAEFTLYQVAAMVDRGGYTVLELTGGFEGCGVQLKNLTAQQSKDASAALLEYQRANHISGDTKRTDANGKISWTGLQTGLYLLVPGQMQKYRTDPSLVSIPTNLNAQLLYDMSVNPKAERIPDPVYPPEESEEPSTPEVKKPPKKTETIVTPGITPEQKTPDPGERENFGELPEKEEDIPEEKQTEELPPLKQTTRKKTKGGTVDIGKMTALRNAGWTYKQIAEEMKLTDKQVSNYLYNAKKRGLQ